MTTPEDADAETTMRPRGRRKDAAENARSGFDAAISLWASEGDMIWSKFAGMMAAHAILIAAIGLAFSTEERDLRVLVFVLAGLGVLLGVAWLLITGRSFAFQKYWIFSARELEQEWLQPVSFIARGEKLAVGHEVHFNTTPPRSLMAPCVGRVRVQNLMYAVITLFILVYPVLIILACCLIPRMNPGK